MSTLDELLTELEDEVKKIVNKKVLNSKYVVQWYINEHHAWSVGYSFSTLEEAVDFAKQHKNHTRIVKVTETEVWRETKFEESK